MSLKFYVGNLVDQATLTPSSENALFPAENILDPRRTKVFRSTTEPANLVLDFQETSEIDSVFIVNNPFDGFGISTLEIELNATNTWGSPAHTESVTWSTKHDVGFKEFTLQNYRFARLVMTSSLEYCELSKIFIGKALDIGRGPNFGWTYQLKDNSRIQENRYGQKFVDVINRQRQFTISISNLDKDMLDKFFEIYDDKGISEPFFVRIGCDTMVNETERFAGMVYMTQAPSITNRFFNNYSLSITLEEAM
jgi:hypothetical protein